MLVYIDRPCSLVEACLKVHITVKCNSSRPEEYLMSSFNLGKCSISFDKAASRCVCGSAVCLADLLSPFSVVLDNLFSHCLPPSMIKRS